MGMLMGAELQAAILQKRTQLRPVAAPASTQTAAPTAHQAVQGGPKPPHRQSAPMDAGQDTVDFMQEVSTGMLSNFYDGAELQA
jgi:hypothetical protein